ncbi:hypothetical protein, conserved [Plasmodium ovale wallikeri]|uniref:Uncharacterized protein n=1 Tax=Plasmodium ovale wallikeri TaxID=864142 RepID=A0A1A8Z0G5_PLAOA|nr:hypothetical protein, conserved [Plasmodium ovale wallikeri]
MGLNSKQAGSAWKKKDEKNNDDQGEEKEKKIDDESFPDLLESTEKIKAELTKDKDKKKKQVKDLKKGEENFVNNNGVGSGGTDKGKGNALNEKKKFGINMFDGVKKNDNNSKKWFDQSNDMNVINSNVVNDNNDSEINQGYILPGFRGKHMIGFKCFLKRGVQTPAPQPPSVPYEESSYFENIDNKTNMQKKYMKMAQQMGQQMGHMINPQMGQLMNQQMGQPIAQSMIQPMNMHQQRNNMNSGMVISQEGGFERNDQGNNRFPPMPQHGMQNGMNVSGVSVSGVSVSGMNVSNMNVGGMNMGSAKVSGGNNSMQKLNNFNRNVKNLGNNNNGEDIMISAKMMINGPGIQGNNMNYSKRNDKKDDNRGFKKKDIDTESNWRNASTGNRNITTNRGITGNRNITENKMNNMNVNSVNSMNNMNSVNSMSNVNNVNNVNSLNSGNNKNVRNYNSNNMNNSQSNVKNNFGNNKMANATFQASTYMSGNNKNIFNKNDELKNSNIFKGNMMNIKNEEKNNKMFKSNIGNLNTNGGTPDVFNKIQPFGNNGNNGNNSGGGNSSSKFDFYKNVFGSGFGLGNKNMSSLDTRKARMREMRNMNEQNKMNEGSPAGLSGRVQQ